jgi:hypothetical protein
MSVFSCMKSIFIRNSYWLILCCYSRTTASEQRECSSEFTRPRRDVRQLHGDPGALEASHFVQQLRRAHLHEAAILSYD